ncbi:MAG: HAMP domain-containing sensor histidine kinase, partial [Halobacteria archaeon]|nr:HAMP domain-containing sensor histidine kinase [Halobacteria archaeon]
NLRNEMNIILGYAEILVDELQNSSLETSVREVKQTGEELVEMSNKARYVEEVIRGQRNRQSSFDIENIISGVIEKFEKEYPDDELDVFESDEDERWVSADNQIRVAIEELVENAIQHNDTPEPEVHISVSPADAMGWVEIEIEDNGPGIPEEERKVLEKGEETPLAHGSGFG